MTCDRLLAGRLSVCTKPSSRGERKNSACAFLSLDKSFYFNYDGASGTKDRQKKDHYKDKAAFAWFSMLFVRAIFSKAGPIRYSIIM